MQSLPLTTPARKSGGGEGLEGFSACFALGMENCLAAVTQLWKELVGADEVLLDTTMRSAALAILWVADMVATFISKSCRSVLSTKMGLDAAQLRTGVASYLQKLPCCWGYHLHLFGCLFGFGQRQKKADKCTVI